MQPKLRITVTSERWDSIGGTKESVSTRWHISGTGNLTESDASNLGNGSSRQLQTTQHHQSGPMAGSHLWGGSRSGGSDFITKRPGQGRLVSSQNTKAAEQADDDSGAARMVLPRADRWQPQFPHL